MRGRAAFERVFAHGVRHRVGGILIVTAPGAPGPARVGLVAGRKLGGAVRRNTAKRRLREVLRRVRLEEGQDYVVVASPSVADAPFAELISWVEEAVGEGRESPHE